MSLNVLVTGGAGYLGSVVSSYLLLKGHKVRVLDSLLHGGHSLLGLYPNRNFEFICGDLREDLVLERSLVDINAIVHLAAIVGDPACAREPKVARSVNLDGSLRLFDLAKQLGIERFVFGSTCSNYGKMSDSLKYVNEDSELSPVSLYAENKVQVEQTLLDSDVDSDTTVTVLRFATAFGVSPRMRFDLTVNEFTMELLINRKLVVYGEQFWRPYIHVSDIAQAIALVLKSSSDQVGGRVFNVGSTRQNYRKGEIVDLICSLIRHEVEIERVHKDEDPRDYRVSFDRINRELGFDATRTVEDGIIEIADLIRHQVITDFGNPYYRN